MKRRLFAYRYFFSLAVLLLLLAASATRTYADCPTHSPGELEGELQAALNNIDKPSDGQLATFWRTCLEPGFLPWAGKGSQNLPVVAAAVGLFREPNTFMRNSQITYVDWWITYLSGQTGKTSQPNPPGLRFFKGTELFSNIYDAPVVTAIISVRYWAFLKRNDPRIDPNKDSKLIDLSLRYLRANWAIYGMAAGSGPAWTYYMDGVTPYDPNSPRRSTGGYAYSGHFMALGGTRSKLSHWATDDKAPLFNRAIEEWPVSQSNENPPQRDVLNLLKTKWNSLSARPLENLYGLNGNDRTNFQTLYQDGSNVSYFMPWLTDIRTSTTYRILGWPGFRASLMEKNVNWINTCMYGISYRASDQLASFLFPWDNKLKASAASYGRGWIEGNRMWATNDPAPSNHLPQTVGFDLQPGQPLFHLVLSENAQPYLENSPLAYSPPPSAPIMDWPRNPDVITDCCVDSDVP